MEKGQGEYFDKIRNAIKEKLVDMGSFIDDELPEYIMILVANKRSKVHIEKDLSLFLGNEASEFTDWLCDLINNLKSGPKNFSIGKTKEEDSETEDADILALNPQEQESEFLNQEEVNSEAATAPFKTIQQKPTVEINREATPRTTLAAKERNEVPKAAKVYPIQKIKDTVTPSGSSKTILSNRSVSQEYDPLNPSVENVSSMARVSQRKYSLPTALQANKLLLRAVDDATKSVLAGKNLNEFYRPTPIKVLSSEISGTSIKSLPNEKIKPRLYNVTSNAAPGIIFEQDYVDVKPPMEIMPDAYTCQIPQARNHVILAHSNSEMYPQSDGEIAPEESVLDVEIEEEDVTMAEPENTVPESPRFFVTLQGVNFESLKRKRSLSSKSLESVEEGDDDSIMSEENSPKKKKVSEKCRYWPACKNGDRCQYHHPNTPCKLFPNCRFAEKCLYIHPNCKFDARCTRKDCPYTHASPRRLSPVNCIPSPMIRPQSKVVCRYFPNCCNKTCPYLHPKPCWFGNRCKSAHCTYTHLPSRNQLKWHAQE